uniref:Uncharacterized protein n=1 Tax=viral metagenome TaxID=1070528 RepID=A0A6C0JTJ3_9ZZZZ
MPKERLASIDSFTSKVDKIILRDIRGREIDETLDRNIKDKIVAIRRDTHTIGVLRERRTNMLIYYLVCHVTREHSTKVDCKDVASQLNLTKKEVSASVKFNEHIKTPVGNMTEELVTKVERLVREYLDDPDTHMMAMELTIDELAACCKEIFSTRIDIMYVAIFLYYCDSIDIMSQIDVTDICEKRNLKETVVRRKYKKIVETAELRLSRSST